MVCAGVNLTPSLLGFFFSVTGSVSHFFSWHILKPLTRFSGEIAKLLFIFLVIFLSLVCSLLSLTYEGRNSNILTFIPFFFFFFLHCCDFSSVQCLMQFLLCFGSVGAVRVGEQLSVFSNPGISTQTPTSIACFFFFQNLAEF